MTVIHRFIEIQHIVIRVMSFVGVFDVTSWIIEEYLSVAHCPISYSKHGKWSHLQNRDSLQIELGIVDWWLSVVVGQA